MHIPETNPCLYFLPEMTSPLSVFTHVGFMCKHRRTSQASRIRKASTNLTWSTSLSTIDHEKLMPNAFRPPHCVCRFLFGLLFFRMTVLVNNSEDSAQNYVLEAVENSRRSLPLQIVFWGVWVPSWLGGPSPFPFPEPPEFRQVTTTKDPAHHWIVEGYDQCNERKARRRSFDGKKWMANHSPEDLCIVYLPIWMVDFCSKCR